ncbi:hypothetical protein DFJ73DRAFT_656471 [Zopfochytrium polystomum]|nr:hypothetical protein DFJ73DRAFT_656471 [Zopfochytrium polystomum]
MEDGKSKLGFVWGLLRRMASVKDIASVRMSLPANLMDPSSNLEFWNYNDRPDLFASIPDEPDPVLRMLRVVRWFLSKDTKWKDNQLRKPYNPVLGETFACHWLVPAADLAAVPTLLPDNGGVATTSPAAATSAAARSVRIDCLTEQILHTPPVSAFYYDCPEKGITARGVDHVSAKFTGTAIKVGAGAFNAGVYLSIRRRRRRSPEEEEEYNMTYPWASINGWLSGKPYITVSETTVVSCPATGLRCILLYKDEPFFGSPKFAVEGRVIRYDPAREARMTEKERREAEKREAAGGGAAENVVARLWGAWNGKVHACEQTLLFDLQQSFTHPKLVSPLPEQSPTESRRLWQGVTEAILRKDFSTATALKREIEERQRRKRDASGGGGAAAARPVPRFFRFRRGAAGKEVEGALGDAAFFDVVGSSGGLGGGVMEKGKPYLVDRVAS